MGVLAIDYGEKQIGLAIEIENIAFSLGIYSRLKIFSNLKKIIIEKNITEIVIGKPLMLDLEEKKILEKTKKFKEKLEKTFINIKINFIDERFTTKIIDNSFGKRDDLSAVLILETYLSRKKRKQNLQ